MTRNRFQLRFFYLIPGVILLLHLLFLAYARIQEPPPLEDGREYLEAANNLYRHGVLYTGDLSEVQREESFTRRPPVYPLFLGFALITRSVFPVLLLQVLLSLLSISLVYRMFLGEYRFGEHPMGEHPHVWLPALFLLMTPAQFIYSSQVMAEIPFQCILVLLIWSIYRYAQSPAETRYIWLFNLMLALGMATKPVLFPFALLWMVASVFLYLRVRKSVFLVALLLPALWISAYTLRNYIRSGSVEYSSIQTTNLLNYNLRYYVMESEGMDAATEKVDGLYETCGEESTYRQQRKCLGEGARKVLLERPLKYAWFHAKGSLRFFLDPGRFDLVHFFQLQEDGAPGFLSHLHQHGLKGIGGFLRQQGALLVGILVFVFLFKIIKITGFFLYLLRSTQPALFKMILLSLVAYLALVTGPLGASRFLLPVELLIMGASAQGWILWVFTGGRRASLHIQDPENL